MSYEETLIRLKAELEHIVPGGVRSSVNLAEISRWRIGGEARLLIAPRTIEEVSTVCKALAGSNVPYCVIGQTSNLLFDSEGFDGIIVQISSEMSGYVIEPPYVTARGGTAVPELARATGQAGLSGLEHTVGIPGTIGGLVMMNGGSQRKGVGASVVDVTVVTNGGEVRTLTQEECRFAYRTSVFRETENIIVSVRLKLSTGEASDILREMDEIVQSRKERFPGDEPNCGSTFLSDPKMYTTVGPPGAAIESVGLKGAQIGGAQVSEKHANFINNAGGATSKDVLRLIKKVRDRVHAVTGFALEAEARYVASNGEVTSASDAAEKLYPTDPTMCP